MKTLRQPIAKTLGALTACLLAGTTARAELVFHADFNDNSLNSSLNDITGTANGDASIVSAETPDFQQTLALSLDGVGDYVSYGNPAILAITGPISISFWVKSASAAGSFETILSKGDAFWAFYRRDQSGTESLAFGVQNPQVVFTSASSTVWDGNWHSVIATYNPGAGGSLYIDGNPAASSATQNANSATNALNFVLGGRSTVSGADRLFDGLLDEVNIYNHVLSTEEISALYAAGITPVPEPGVWAIAGVGLLLLWQRTRRANGGA